MKKKYVKSQIYIETFSLSMNIAGDCEGIVGNATKGTCAVEGTGGIPMFSGTVSACEFVSEQDVWNGFCYHVPTEKYTLFNS
jgi:hypothetical protein